jgi:hypothetical protein
VRLADGLPKQLWMGSMVALLAMPRAEERELGELGLAHNPYIACIRRRIATSLYRQHHGKAVDTAIFVRFMYR